MTSTSADGVGPIDVGEAESWVRSHLPIAGPLRHVQTEPWAAVFRAPSDGGIVWFKACAPHQAFEVSLTAALSSRWDVVTEVVAHDLDRRWLLMADAGTSFRRLGNPPERWLEALPAYAQLQIGETERADRHLAQGVPDRSLTQLPALFHELTRAELPLRAHERTGLRAFGPRFSALCEELDGDGVGPTVQHDDLHMNNVYVNGGAIRVLDWGDASIAHPFFSLFETFRFLEEFNRLSAWDPSFARLRDAYLEPWGRDRRATFDRALRIGGVARAIAWLQQRAALPERQRPGFDRGFAALLRRAMERATAEA